MAKSRHGLRCGAHVSTSIARLGYTAIQRSNRPPGPIMPNKGFLLVLMQPPPAFEEEFNAWYDTEHVPERVAVPGFETGIRFVCIDGTPKYLAIYDLEKPEVLDSPEYDRVAGDKSGPWTKRVTSRVKIYRSAGAQIYPGNQVTGRCARVKLLRFRGLAAGAQAAIVSGMRTNFETLPETIQVRVFAYDTGKGVDFLGMVGARAPIDARLDLAAFGGHADALDLVNTYAPY
jgi:hypothetical protein